MGYKVNGYTVRLQDDLTSIPGLVSLLDSRFLVDDNVSTGLLTWSDVNNILRYRTIAAPQKPAYASSQIVFENDAGLQQKSLHASLTGGINMNFLVDGSPFGVYSLQKNTIPNAVSVFINFSTVSSGQVYFGFRIENTSDFKVQIRDSGGSTVNLFSKTSFIPDDVYYSLGLARTSLSNSNNFILSKNEVVDSFATSSITNPNVIAGSRIGGQDTNSIIRKTTFGLILLYNWAGKTESEVINYDTKIRSLLASYRTQFSSL